MDNVPLYLEQLDFYFNNIQYWLKDTNIPNVFRQRIMSEVEDGKITVEQIRESLGITVVRL